jgi:serine/threonine-protein kinase
MAGQTLGLRYRVIRELGHGGFGRTYLAEDTHRFHEYCVLKEFAPQVQGTEALHKAEELFEREAGILHKLQHPQIPRFRELFQADWQGKRRLFLVQDYVEGETYQALLRSRQAQGYGFTEAEVIQLLVQLLPVLDYIHRCGVIHRDISPDNLILRSADGLPVLIDFGGVKQAAAEVNSQLRRAIAAPANVTRLGKAGYAPSEQMDHGEVSPHSDLYALAATVLVLLTGKEPQDLLVGNRRQWQRQVTVSPKLANMLNRMLDPYPSKRYQSAQEVMQALGASPDYSQNSPLSNGQRSPSALYLATLAVSPAQSGALTQGATAYSPLPRVRRPVDGWGGVVGTIALLLLTGATIWGAWWVAADWKPTPSKPQPVKPGTPSTNNSASPQFSQAEQDRKQALNNRREELEIDAGFLTSLVNATFYDKHPDRVGRQLTADSADANLRAEWDRIASDWLNQLKPLNADARSRLGSYTDADVQARQAAVNQLNLSGRALNDLTDVQFFYLFPDQPRNQNLLNKPIGQVWQAIASEQLSAVKAGTALETIKFPEGRFSQQVSGTLKPGEGKAYIAQLTKDQVIQITLQASRAMRLSIYPPTSKAAALLEDSSKTSWSGKLMDSGFYEVVIVSDASGAIDYDLSLAAADHISSPDTTQ